MKTEGRVELKDNAVPTLQISFRAKDAPDIVESIEQVPDTAEDESPGSSTADHSYSTADQEPVTSRSVEVAMKEHSYFTGVALQCSSPPSGQPMLPEALEAPEDHTYHTNVPLRLSLDDHTYNRGEAALVNPLSKPPQSDDLNVPPAAPVEEEQREEACIRNFDHTYNNKKNAESPAGPTVPQESETPVATQTASQPASNNHGNHMSLRKGKLEIFYQRLRFLMGFRYRYSSSENFISLPSIVFRRSETSAGDTWLEGALRGEPTVEE